MLKSLFFKKKPAEEKEQHATIRETITQITISGVVKFTTPLELEKVADSFRSITLSLLRSATENS